MRNAIGCLTFLLVAAGCAARMPHPDAVRIYTGTYQFSGKVENEEVSGQLSFGDKQYSFESTFGACIEPIHHLLLSRVPDRAWFTCDGFAIVLERRDGRFNDRANVSYTRVVQVGTRRECVRWRVDDQGRTLCVQYMDRPIENRVTSHGVVQVTHVTG